MGQIHIQLKQRVQASIVAIKGDEELDTLIKGTIVGGGVVHGGWQRRSKRFDLFLLFPTYFVAVLTLDFLGTVHKMYA